MEKLLQALQKLLKPEEVNEVANAVKAMMAESETQIRAEYEKRLEEAYENVAEEAAKVEEVAKVGYQQAYDIIMAQQKQIEEQREEFENAIDEGFEEAFKDLEAEKAKNQQLEVELYEEFDKKLKEMRDYMVNKVDQFLTLQEAELYEAAKRDVMDDPRLVEHKVAMDKIVGIIADQLSDEDLSGATSRKLDEAYKMIEDLRGQMKIVEARNSRLSVNNTKLTEEVRAAKAVINESKTHERKERAGKKENVSGRGQRDLGERILSEYVNPEAAQNKRDRQDLNESSDLNDLLVLSGVPMNDPDQN